jgi:hypothetical protein
MTTALHSLTVLIFHLSMHQLWCESETGHSRVMVKNSITFTLPKPAVNIFSFSLDDTVWNPNIRVAGSSAIIVLMNGHTWETDLPACEVQKDQSKSSVPDVTTR